MDLADLTRDLEALRDEALAAIAASGGRRRARGARARRPRQEGPADRRSCAASARCRPTIGPRVGAVANAVRERDRGRARRARRGPARLGPGRRASPPRRVDVTTPGRPIRRGTPPPDHRDDGRDRRDLRPVRLRRLRGPRDRGRPDATSRCSTSRPTTRRATCGTRSTSTSRATSCGPTRRPARSG